MPLKYFICQDNEQIAIDKCLQKKGCRLKDRCATLPYLRMIGYDREWRGITPSMAGTGPRQIYLKATTDYAVSPNSRAFSALGVAVHNKLSIHKYSHNVLSEETLSDDESKGIADLLEEDENKEGYFILEDYKSAGSYNVAQWLGIVKEKELIPILDEEGNPVLLKSGPNMGKPKTRTETTFIIDPDKIQMENEELQINRYRLFYESYGFPVSKMYISSIVRDGGIMVASSRGITQNIYKIPVKRLDDEYVLETYRTLKKEVEEGFGAGFCRMCTTSETWDGRRCEKYCEVNEACKEMGE